MKPRLLTITAFGPFREQQQIDFDQLDTPLFLINGPTGAGKSTILDAICFALYGETTSDRAAEQMRCQLAGGETLTEVSLTFSIGQRFYRVDRIPRQMRDRARGTGQTEQKPTARLWQLDNETETLLVPRGVNEVTRYIIELTGLNCDQFRQVVILPQGKFRELLLARSDEREKIFSALFRTGIYKQIEDSLKQQSRDIRHQVTDYQNQVKGMLRAAGVGSEQELEQQLSVLSGRLSEQQESHREIAGKMTQAQRRFDQARHLQKAWLQLRTLQRAAEQLEAQAPEIQRDQIASDQAQAALELEEPWGSMQQTAAHHRHLAGQLEQAVRAVTDAEQQLREAERANEQQQALSQQREALLVEQQALLQIGRKIAQSSTLQASVRQSATQLGEATRAVERVEAAIADNLQQQQGCQEQLRVLQQRLNTREQVQEDRNRLHTQVTLLSGLQQLQMKQQQQTNSHQQQTSQWQAAVSRQREAARSRQQLELRWHGEQAGLLAAELSENQPCPVCGSLEHPQPASGPADGHPPVTREMLAQSREVEQQHQAQVHRLDKQREVIQQRMSQLQRDIEQHHQQLRPFSSLTLDEANVELARSEAALVELAENQQQQLQLLSRQESLSGRQRQMQTELVGLQSSMQQLRAEHTRAETELQTMLAGMDERWLQQGAVERRNEEINNNLKRLAASIESLQQQLQKTQQLLAGSRGRKDSLEIQVKEAAERLNQASLHWEQRLSVSNFTDVKAFEQARMPADARQALQQRLLDYTKALDHNRGALSAQRELTGDQPEPDMQAFNRELEQAQQQHQQSQQSVDTVQQNLAALLQSRDAIGHVQQQHRALDERYRIVGRLSDVASGQTDSRINLQRYVLSVLLDDVLLDASRRLQSMSRNRYHLVRRETADGKRSTSGLALNVFDAYAGYERPVSTLSGGESFQAALALALGLSEVVQAYAGGIRIEAIFIDEGFGSLDADALDLATDMLMALGADGRMVGVISHVSEMKARISRQMLIQSGVGGSSIRQV